MGLLHLLMILITEIKKVCFRESDLIVSRTGAVGNPLFANQRKLSWIMKHKLVLQLDHRCIVFSCVQSLPRMKFPMSSLEPREKRRKDLLRGQLVSTKTLNNIQRLGKLVEMNSLTFSESNFPLKIFGVQ